MSNFENSLQDYAKRAPVSSIGLTFDQAKQMDIVLSWCVFHQPFFANLLMGELPIIPTKSVPIAATDSFAIFINPDEFFKYTLGEQAFILFHETLHCVFGDCLLALKWAASGKVLVDGKGTTLPYDSDIMNKAMDYVINAMLIEGRLGTYNSQWLNDASLSSKGDDAVVDVYAKLWSKRKPGGGGQPGGKPGPGPGQPGPGQSSFDQHLQPGAQTGQDPAQAAKQRDPATWQAAIAAAAQAADLQGKLPGSLKRLVGELLNPKVSWQEHIRSSLNRIAGSEGLDWTAADRRMLSRPYVGAQHKAVFFARSSGFSCGTIVCGVDTSGSVDDHQVAAYFREMHGMLEDLNPSSVVIIQCDAAVHDVDEIEEFNELDAVRRRGTQGGGGTDFKPVFEKIAELGLEPDALIYLTDMYGSFPAVAPSYPVIWGSTTKSVTSAPFGEVIYVEV